MNKGLRAAIAISILVGGVVIFKYLVNTKPEAKRSIFVNHGATVEIIKVGATSTTVKVRARGTVMPARQVILGSEVGGKVINIDSELQPGGKFKQGDIIARINPADYRIAVEQQFALVDSAEAQLAVEESRRAVAEREWEMFGSKRKEGANRQLALREPQLRSAETQLKSAKSGLKRARLGVERTLVRAPFDGMVQNRNVELGQIVGPGAGLLSFVGTNSYWVQLSVPVERLVWIAIPGVNGQQEGSHVTIHHRVGHEHIEKEGRVLRLLSEVDPAGRMARLLVEVNDPLGLQAEQTSEAPLKTESPKENTSKLPLLLGTYVDVEIEGRKAENIIELERAALREGDMVYVMTADSTLKKRKVEVLWRRENTVLISGGLTTGESVIISPLASAVEGMKLRLPGQDEPSEVAPKRPQEASATGTPATAGVPGSEQEARPL